MRKILIFLMLCIFSTQVVSATTLPYWYLNPPASDRKSLIGVGQGSTAADATAEALAQIASKLSVTVSSSLEKTEQQNKSGDSTVYSSAVQANVKSQVAAIKFNNYEVSDNAVIDHQIYMMVTVDRAALLADKHNELTNADFEIDSLYKAAIAKPIMERILDLRKMSAKIQQTMPLVSLVAYLDPEFAAAQNFSKYNRYLAEDRASASKVHIFVSSESGAEGLIQVVIGNLNNIGITVAPTLDRLDLNLVRLHLRADIHGMDLYGAKMVRMTSTLELHDTSGLLVASAKLDSKGSSAISLEEAGRVAIRDLDAQLRSRGILSVLGIK